MENRKADPYVANFFTSEIIRHAIALEAENARLKKECASNNRVAALELDRANRLTSLLADAEGWLQECSNLTQYDGDDEPDSWWFERHLGEVGKTARAALAKLREGRG